MVRSLLVSLLVLAGCAKAPPARTSPELAPFATVSLYESEVRSRHGVTMFFDALATEDGNVGSAGDGGILVVRTSAQPTRGLCVIGEERGVRITETGIEIFDGEVVHHTATVEDAFGASIEVQYPSCSALSLDDVWVGLGASLAHWDGVAWSTETLPQPSDVSVTEQYLYVSSADGLHRRPRAGGAFERVAKGGSSRILREIDATRVGLLFADMYDQVERVEVYSDAGEVTAIAVAGSTAGSVSSGEAWFDRTGRLWAGVLLTEGEVDSSFGGSTTRYYPDWYQVLLHATDATGTLVELAHLDHVYATRELGPEPLFVFPAGDDAIVGFRGSLFRVPD